MLKKEEIQAVVETAIENTDLFLVDISVTADNTVTVTIDSPSGVDIERCVAINRAIENKFNRDIEDYELEVGSAGVTAPMKVQAQYNMNIGNDVEIITRDGRKIHATLTQVDPGFNHITVEVATKIKEEGAKRPVIKMVPQQIALDNIKSCVRELKF